MTETLGVLAYFFFPAFTGFIGAYCGLIKKRTSKISFPEALVIFLITWPVTALAVFILSTIVLILGQSLAPPLDLIVSLIVSVGLARWLIQIRERRNGYRPQS